MFDLGFQELLLIVVVVLVLFGGRKLPELAKGISQSIREIKKGFSDEDKKDNKDIGTTKDHS